jgi:GNAT superfamily N-acetyltransferase
VRRLSPDVPAPGVRPAGSADIARVAELCRKARAELAPQRGGAIMIQREARPEPVEESLTAMLSDGRRALWAGMLAAEIVGYAAVRVEPLFDGRILGVVEDLYVESEARAVGVGECLVNALLAWCRHRDCVGVDAHALPGSRATKNFFEESGFTARLLVMHRALVADGDG